MKHKVGLYGLALGAALYLAGCGGTATGPVGSDGGGLDLAGARGTRFEGGVWTCAGEVATIVGTSGDDAIDGTPNHDVIVGLDGHDVINGGGGGDLVCGGPGDDTLNGDGGSDRMYGESGNDTLNGEDGNDTIEGDAGDDVMDGGPGNDRVTGGDGNDNLFGDGECPPQNELGVLNGICDPQISPAFGGDDFLGGGNGDDTLTGGPRRDRFNGGKGNDTVTDYECKIDTIVGGVENGTECNQEPPIEN
jgi:Ca2+-binding RTX toxin-like protein